MGTGGREMERVLSLLDEAIEIEKKGAAFYKGLISTTSNRLAKDIFMVLADDELRHREIFEGLRRSLEGGEEFAFDEEPGLRSVAIYGDVSRQLGRDLARKDLMFREKSGATVVDALRTARRLEMRSIEHYMGILRDVGEGPGTDEFLRRVLLRILAEEILHLKFVEAQFEHLKATGFWYEPAAFREFRRVTEEELRAVVDTFFEGL